MSSTRLPLSTRKYWFGAIVIVAIVGIVFFAATQLQFVGDDWIFLDIVGRLDWQDYLVKYFDPRMQTAWYRPVQGIQYLIGYQFFGSDPLGYHVENVLLHLANCLLLYGVVIHATKRWRIGFVAALLYATFPIAVEAIFKAGVIDPLLTTFSLLSAWLWLRYLEAKRMRDYVFAFIAFLFALYCKEISIMLPVVLFSLDRFFVAKPATFSALVRRYLAFALAFVPYLPIEYIVTRRSVFVATEGYSPSLGIIQNLFGYMGGLAFPWAIAFPFSYFCLAMLVGILAYWILVKKQYAFLCLGVVGMLPVLPILPFPEISPRFLYFPLVASAIFFALVFDWVWRRLPAGWVFQILVYAVVGLGVLFGGATIASATAGFAEFSRVSRVPFRNVRQLHPDLPENTLLFFVDPPLPGSNLGGMFFSRYGRGVLVRATDTAGVVNLRNYATAYLYYFDAQGNQIELPVEKESLARVTPAMPVNFSESIQLESLELVSTQALRGKAVAFLSYWHATEPIKTDYTVFAYLIDENGKQVAGYEKEPRRGKASTSAWQPNQQILDAVVLPIPSDLALGTYRLQIGLYDAATSKRVGILGANGQIVTDSILIEPIRILE